MSTTGLKVAVLLLFTGLLYGQSITGTIVGTITDSSGAPIPGANVQIKNQDTHSTRSLTTNGQGDYAATLLPPGNYAVSVQHQGFKPSELSGVEVRVDRSIRADLRLDLGNVSEAIT